MKKLKYLFLIMVATFMSVPSVNADLVFKYPERLESSGSLINMTSWNPTPYLGVKGTKDIQNYPSYTLIYHYSNFLTNLDTSKTYTVSFVIDYNNILALASGDNYYYMQRGSFVSTWDDLNSDKGGLCSANISNEPSNLYTLVCENVTPSSSFALRFDIQQLQAFEGTPKFSLGIWDGISVFESSSTSIVDSVKEQTKKLDELNENITSSDTSSSQGQANSFFEGFKSSDYGLSDIITMPLDLIRGLTNNTCVSLKLTLPFVNKTFDLPCMSSIYSQYFGSFFDLYQTITFGFVAYWVIVKIFALVKGFKDPDDDKVEVLDL